MAKTVVIFHQEWRTKKRKGRKMIKRLECFENGELGQMSLENVREYVRHRLRENIIMCDNPKLDTLCVEDYSVWVNDLFCNKKVISLNDKNIEYSEDFWVVNGWGLDAEFGKALARYDISDILVHIFVYRVGSYSYWMAICNATTGNEPRCEG